MISTNKKAFTLIEVLFTLAIISIAAMAIARSSMNNLAAVNKNRLRLNALNLAQCRLVECIADQSYSPGNSGIETISNTDYKWRTGSTDITIADSSQKLNFTMKNISVTASWNENGQEKSITLRQYLWQNTEQKAQLSSN